MTPFTLPDLGEGLQSAEIVAWHVAEGEHVVADQPLLSIETEKAVVEIPSPQSGRIAQLVARPGDRVPVGAPLLVFEEGPHRDTGTVVGDLEAPEQPPQRQNKPPFKAESAEKTESIHAAPAVRARARALGVNLSRITPTGPSGTVTMADVMSVSAAVPHKDTNLRGARRTMAENMSRAWREVAHATLHNSADIETWSTHKDITIRLVRALIAGCKAQPMMNAGFDAKTLSLNPNESIDLGLAMDSPDGLFVPVLRDVARSQPADWRRQINAFKIGVRERSLPPADFRNPTITLSNFGTIAGTHAVLIIVPSQVAILGAGRISDRPARAPSGIALHRSLPLSLTFDHRAVSGGDAARFLRAVIDDLELAK